MARLGEICKLNMGQSPDSASYNETGEGIPFFQGNADFGERSPTVRVWCNAPTKIAHAGDILISVRAPIGALNIANTDCCIGRGLAALTVNESICSKQYLWYAIASKVEELNSKGTGSTFKAISKNILSETEIPLPPLDEQRRIAAILDKVTSLITLRKQQLAKLDELVKARFVEMFGDPVYNSKNLSSASMAKICKIIDGDRGHNYPKQEDFSEQGYCVFLNAKNVTSNGFAFDSCMFIAKEKDNQLRKGKLYRGDIVLTTRGTIGNLALYDDSIRFEHMRINSGMVILRLNHKILMDLFFVEQFKLLLPYIKESVASGSAQPQLPVSTMSKIQIILPQIEYQKDFVKFCTQVHGQTLTIQQSLDILEVLKASLMQKNFG